MADSALGRLSVSQMQRDSFCGLVLQRPLSLHTCFHPPVLCFLLARGLAHSGVSVVSAKQNRSIIGTSDEPLDLSILHFWLGLALRHELTM